MIESPLISADNLAQRTQGLTKSDRLLVIVDCRFSLAEPDRGEREYGQAHIPGAVYLSLDRDLTAPIHPQGHGGRHPLPTVAAMEATFSRLGIERGITDVVVYDDSRFAFAARFWWMLRYCGHERVFILDGGFSGWVSAGLAVTSKLSECDLNQPELNQSDLNQSELNQSGSFVAQVQHKWTVDRDRVLAACEQSQITIVDSRSPERYRGEIEPIDPYAGHIPSAIERFWQGVTDEAGIARSPEEQWQRWQAIANRNPVMIYCGSGVTACVNLLSIELARQHDPTLAIMPQLYAGSWSDWCAHITDRDDPLIARGA